jgi:hypothetical protein
VTEAKRKYDATVARIAGNLLSGVIANGHTWAIPPEAIREAVKAARAIVDGVQRTEGNGPEVAP